MDFDWEGAQVLGSLFCQVCLQLAPILLVLLNEELVLVRDVVVVQKWSFVEPVWQVWDRGLHNFERAVLVDVLAIGSEQKILLHLAVLAEGRLEADVVEGSHVVVIGDVLDVVYCPFCEPRYAIGLILVSLVLFDLKLAIAFEGQEVAVWRHQADRLAEHHWLLRLPVVEFQYDELF